MKRVIIESRYAGDIERHLAYARACLADSVGRGEAPIAFHLLYPLVLDDAQPEDREQGLAASAAWYESADLVAVYTDLGVSAGMQRGIAVAESLGVRVDRRSLLEWRGR